VLSWGGRCLGFVFRFSAALQEGPGVCFRVRALGMFLTFCPPALHSFGFGLPLVSAFTALRWSFAFSFRAARQELPMICARVRA
jgi:hypothetical protein